MIVGNSIADLFVSVQRGTTFAAVRAEGLALRGPSAPMFFLEPLATKIPSDGVHMLWSEPAPFDSSPQTVIWAGLAATAGVWTASYDSVGGWTTPQLLSNEPVVWMRGAIDDIAEDGARRLVAVPLTNERRNGLVVLRYDGLRWTSSIVTLLQAPVSATAVIRGHMAWLVFVAAHLGHGPDVNSIFLVRSEDAGGTWSQPELLSRSGRLPASSVKLRLTPDGRLHLVWLQQLADGGRVLRHRSSAAHDARWTANDDLPIETSVTSPQVTADACSRLHVVFENYDASSGQGALEYVLWDTTWKGRTRLYPGVRAIEPAVRATSRYGLMLVTLQQPLEALPGTRYETMVSYLPTR